MSIDLWNLRNSSDAAFSFLERMTREAMRESLNELTSTLAFAASLKQQPKKPTGLQLTQPPIGFASLKSSLAFGGQLSGSIGGMAVLTSEQIPRTAVFEELPRERFFVYEESDRAWLKGLGLLVQVERPVIYQIMNCLHMHPETYEKVIAKIEGVEHE